MNNRGKDAHGGGDDALFSGGDDALWVYFEKDEAHCRREREKARALRASPWWKAQLARGICHWCGKKFPPNELTMDHVIPVARGGTSTKGNVVPCCHACNQKKSCITPAEAILDRLAKEGENGAK